MIPPEVPGSEGDVIILKLDPTGSLIWEKTVGGSQRDYAYSVDFLNSGGFVIGGFSESGDGAIDQNNGSSDTLLMKFSTDGIELWQKTYGGSLSENIHSIGISGSGGIFGVGSMQNPLSGNNDLDILLMRYDEAEPILVIHGILTD